MSGADVTINYGKIKVEHQYNLRYNNEISLQRSVVQNNILLINFSTLLPVYEVIKFTDVEIICSTLIKFLYLMLFPEKMFVSYFLDVSWQ